MTKVSLLYFSPTGTTRRTLEYLAEGLQLPTQAYDLTLFDARWKQYSFGPNDLVIIGLPVYRGILPPITDEFFRGIIAENTPAVFVVTYGNREYENALLELKDRATEAGFIGIAAAATIGEHSITSEVATGRPDDKDRELLRQFGRQVRDKYLQTDKAADFFVPGARPYAKTVTNHTVLLTGDSCDDCGLCASDCPVLAINPANIREIDSRRCIGCLRCVHYCPQNTRTLPEEHRNMVVAMLKKTAANRKEPEFFI